MKPHTPDFILNFKFEYKITLTYLIFGILWILFSDNVLDLLLSDDSLLTEFQIYKGSFFIMVTSGFLYFFVKSHMKKLRFAESERIESERHYKALFNDNLQVILLVNPQTGKIEDANQAACNYYGWTHYELCKKHIYDINILTVEQINESLKSVVADLKMHFEFQHRLASGEVRDVEVFTGPIRLAKGTLIYSHINDITERKQVEEKLYHSEERLSKIFHLGPVAKILTRISDAVVFDINTAAEQLFGYKREEVIGSSSGSSDFWFDPSDRLYFTEIFRKQGFLHGVEFKFKATTGKTGWASIYTEMFDINGEKYLLNEFIDITDRKRAEDQVKDLNEELENRITERTNQLLDSNKELESFAYSVSHDLRAPLRHVIGFSEMLESELKDRKVSEITRLTGKIKSSASKMSRLIDELLSYSRLGRTDLKTIKLSLNAIINSIITEAADVIKERKIEWEISQLPVVSADPTLIKLVLENLIYNSIKFTGKKMNAVIKIGYEEKNNMEYTFYIKDNGAGFKMEYANKLFGVFQRLHTAEEFEGTGIGLATVRRIIIRHHGSVWAEGNEDEGATFFFTLLK